MANLDGNDEVFDSRDVIERIAELEATEVIDREPEDQDELDALYALQKEAEGYGDWQDGETFISDDYFTEYTKELLADIGYIPNDMPDWVVIDWDSTADTVKADYTSYEFMGTTYWAHS